MTQKMFVFTHRYGSEAGFGFFFLSETRFTGLEWIEGRQVDRGSKGQTADRPARVRVSVGVILKRT